MAATPPAIYAAFEDSTRLMQWLPPGNMSGRAISYDFQEGGRYEIELTYKGDEEGAPGKTSKHADVSKGRFVELVPGARIVQSVEFESTDPAFGGEMSMTWSFEPKGAGTKVTITAENVPPGISKEDHDAGLRSSLGNLAKFVSSVTLNDLVRIH